MNPAKLPLSRSTPQCRDSQKSGNQNSSSDKSFKPRNESETRLIQSKSEWAQNTSNLSSIIHLVRSREPE